MTEDEVLNEFLETTSYDVVPDWRALPELGEESDEDDEVVVLGGPGSGNFGHAGRPGQIGGSASAPFSDRGGGQVGEIVGGLTPEDKDLIAGDWAWPDSNPSGIDYTSLRNPEKSEGQRMTGILKKLPVYDGVTYRGVALTDPKDIALLESAAGYELNLHSSASKDLSTAVAFADSNTFDQHAKGFVLELHGRGRDINEHLPEDLQNTKEVVLMAGTKYSFVSKRQESERNFRYTRIVLREMR
jgi:hypothetical protein